MKICDVIRQELPSVQSELKKIFKQFPNDSEVVVKQVSTGEYVHNSNSCSMCKRMIINAGIKQVIVRDDEEHYRVIEVQSWIDNDESLSGISGY